MLLDCGPQAVIEELDEADGLVSRNPLLYLALDHSGGRDYCAGPLTDLGYLTDSPRDLKVYRAWPLLKLGDY